MRCVKIIYLIFLHVMTYRDGLTKFIDINKICQAESGKIATYLHIEQCPTSIEMVKSKGQAKTCYFQGDNPIVYCEDEQNLLKDSNRFGSIGDQPSAVPTPTPIPNSGILQAAILKTSTLPVMELQSDEIVPVITPKLDVASQTQEISPPAAEISPPIAPAVMELQTGEMSPAVTQKLDTPAIAKLQTGEIPLVSKFGTSSTTTIQIGERSRRACKAYESFTKNITYNQLGTEIVANGCPWKSNGLDTGSEQSKIGDSPHMAIIGIYNEASRHFNFLCSGTLISDRFILTLASCLHPKSLIPNSVRIGDIDYTNPNDNEFVQQINIKQNHINPNYIFDQLYYDIGLIELEEPVNLNLYIRPACLYLQEPVSDIPKSTHIGWMTHAAFGITGHLLKTKINTVSTEKCEKVYGNNNRLPRGLDEPSMGCYSFPYADNICRCLLGDPIQTESTTADCSYEVFGMTAFGQICDATPVGYIKIYPYISWIESIVWP